MFSEAGAGTGAGAALTPKPCSKYYSSPHSGNTRQIIVPLVTLKSEKLYVLASLGAGSKVHALKQPQALPHPYVCNGPPPPPCPLPRFN